MLSPFIPSDLVYFTFFHFLILHASSRVTSILFPDSNRVTSIYQIQKVEKISIRIFPFLFPLHVELIFDECYNSNWRKMN